MNHKISQWLNTLFGVAMLGVGACANIDTYKSPEHNSKIPMQYQQTMQPEPVYRKPVESAEEGRRENRDDYLLASDYRAEDALIIMDSVSPFLRIENNRIYPNEVDKNPDGTYKYDFTKPEHTCAAFVDAVENMDSELFLRLLHPKTRQSYEGRANIEFVRLLQNGMRRLMDEIKKGRLTVQEARQKIKEWKHQPRITLYAEELLRRYKELFKNLYGKTGMGLEEFIRFPEIFDYSFRVNEKGEWLLFHENRRHVVM